jgi:antitoxin (DNA-binding transcriptional repressor) of toxin-antitoxin stability system
LKDEVMVRIKVTELSQKIDKLIVKIENGESCLIIKEGKPIAEILPIRNHTQGWKRKFSKVKIPSGISAQAYIEEERNL